MSPRHVSKPLSATRTRRLGSGAKRLSHSATCSEAEIFIIEVELLILELARPCRTKHAHRFRVGQKIHCLHQGLVILNRQQYAHGGMMRRNQNRLLASAELRQAALRFCDRDCGIRSFRHFLRTLRRDPDSANVGVCP